MEQLIEKDHGLTALLAGLVIVLALHLIFKLGHFIWEMNNKKHEVTEKSIENLTSVLSSNTQAIHQLENRVRGVETHLVDFTKFKVDIRLLIQAIKELAGEKWPDIRKIIIEDKFPS